MYKCLNNTIVPVEYSICKDEFYDRRGKICCQGVVNSVRKLVKPKCCEDRVYSSENQSCRGGLVKRKEKEKCGVRFQIGKDLLKIIHSALDLHFPGNKKRIRNIKEKNVLPLIFVHLSKANVYFEKPSKISQPGNDRSP
ncbi:uncharacterized protein LOC133204141 [Saccostrea echinata]|uniref:uncharacterized protein LOC133204141 n=1 Tax=Saccostrea echinata TaxID=191078 RepID=UPI002A83C6A7|nr:uncharacterized protein LOC133204141 [Saccostrea echinata]